MEKRKDDFWAFRKIDTARPKNVIESLETPHFVGNQLLYHTTLLKKTFSRILSAEKWGVSFSINIIRSLFS
jgi:hypothetical protein